jgi:hypothetical protein
MHESLIAEAGDIQAREPAKEHIIPLRSRLLLSCQVNG